MKLNRLCAMLLALCIVFGMHSFTSASDNVLYSVDNPAASTWIDSNASEARGIGGKTENDSCALISLNSGATSGYLQFDNPITGRLDVTFKGNYVIDFNFFAGENFVGNKIIVTTNWGSSVSCDITSQSAGYREGKWNSVRVIYNSENVSSSDGLLGVKATYLNGQPIEGPKQWWRSYSSPFTVFRVGVYGTAGVNNIAYIDDIKIWTTTEEVPVYTASFKGNVIIDGNQIQMAKGSTLASICGGTTSGVTAFRDEAMTQQLGDEEELLDNDTVVVTLPDGNIDYYIVSTCGYKLLLNSEDGTGMTNANVITTVDGCMGKTADDRIKYVDRVYGAVDNDNVGNHKVYTIYEYGSEEVNNKKAGVIVSSLDFCLIKPIDRIYLGTRWGERISPDIKDCFEMNRWNRITFAYYPQTYKDTYWGDVDVYVNGKLVVSGGVSRSKSSTNYINQLRITFDSTNNSSNEIEGYFDNVKFYRKMNPLKDFAEIAEIESNTSAGYVVSGKDIFVESGLTVSSLPQNAVVWNGDYSSIALSNNVLDSNMHVVLTNYEGVYTYYNIKEFRENSIVLSGNGYLGNNVCGNEKFNINLNSAGSLVAIAQYAKNGSLIDISLRNISEGINSFEYTCNNTLTDRIKVMLLGTVNNIAPLNETTIIKHCPEISVLMIGNSYSVDCMRYTREIAEADGVTFNYGMLVRGAATAQFHYDNREIGLSSSESTFFYNGTNMGVATLKSVLDSNYKWDYVIIQDYGVQLVNNSVYDTAPVVGLAQYINEKCPDSEILLHEIWTNEVGSGYEGGISVTDAEYQKVLDGRIHERITSAALAAGQAIGQNTPLRILSSQSVIQAARDYKTADLLDLFNTKYDKGKHTFSDEQLSGSAGDITGTTTGDNKISVGQGILSDVDAQLGRKRLHRDGYHMSVLGRYLTSANAYTFFTGRNTENNSFYPGSDALDSGAYSTSGAWKAVYFGFDAPIKEDIELLRSISDRLVR